MMYLAIIRDYMVRYGWTVKKLSEETGIGRVNLGQKIKGKTAMTVEEFITISRTLCISDMDKARGMR